MCVCKSGGGGGGGVAHPQVDAARLLYSRSRLVGHAFLVRQISNQIRNYVGFELCNLDFSLAEILNLV